MLEIGFNLKDVQSLEIELNWIGLGWIWIAVREFKIQNFNSYLLKF